MNKNSFTTNYWSGWVGRGDRGGNGDGETKVNLMPPRNVSNKNPKRQQYRNGRGPHHSLMMNRQTGHIMPKKKTSLTIRRTTGQAGGDGVDYQMTSAQMIDGEELKRIRDERAQANLLENWARMTIRLEK
jgi:hypothetical protein